VTVESALHVSRSAAKDLTLVADRRAAEDSAVYLRERMGSARCFPDKFALLEAALSMVNPDLGGVYCEFGVYQGTSINYIADRVAGTVHGFDSFEGLPEDWRPGFEAGRFRLERLPAVRPNVRLHRGWFKDSIPRFKELNTGPLAFGHIDGDLYSSTRDIFDRMGDQIVAGTVLQFDEYFNYPGWREGEWKAFEEFCEARHAEIEYIGYVADGEQVAVRVSKIAPVENRPNPGA
jgi:hypothetical protein